MTTLDGFSLTRRGFIATATVGAGAALLPATPASALAPRSATAGLALPAIGIFDTEPATGWTDGFLSANGELGAILHGSPALEKIVLNHHRFVLPNGTRGIEAPDAAARLAEVQDRAIAGDYWGAAARFADGWDLKWTQSFHPAYELRLSSPAMSEYRDYTRTTDYATGEVTHTWSTSHGVWRRRAFVSRASGVVVHELTPPAGATVDLALDIATDLEGAPDSIRYTREATTSGRNGILALRGVYPGGGAFGFEGVTRAVITGVGSSITSNADGLVISKAAKVLLLTKLARYERASEWEGRPVHALLGILQVDYDALLRRHLPQHRDRFGESRLVLDVPDADRARPTAELIGLQNADRSTLQLALLERLFDAGRYHFASSSGILPPRLTGIWAGSWDAAWADDFTTDANVNLQVAGGNILDHGASMDGYFDLVLGQLDDWRANARNLYGARGFLAPSRTDGEHGHMLHFNGDSFPGQCWTGGADWMLYPLLEYYQTTGDEEFLRVRLGPALMELALFYEDFLGRVDANGKRIFVPSFSMENSPSNTGQMLSINATGDIMAGRHALQAAIDAATELGVEGGAGAGIARWTALLSQLPDYRINDDHSLAEWSWPGLADRNNHRHVQHLYGAWPLHEVNPEERPDLMHAARHALIRRGDENRSAHGSLHRALASARLKDGEGVSSNLRKILGENMVWRSLMTSHNPDLHLYNADAANAIPGVLAEALVYSRPGVLELLPAIPPELARGSITLVRGRNRVLVEELAWDLDARTATATIVSDVAQEITLICRRGVVELEVDGASVASSELGDHARVLALPQGTRVTVRLSLLPVVCRLANERSGKVMDVEWASTNDGAPVIQWSWSGASNQRWQLVPGHDGSFRIRSQRSGKVLDNPATSMADGTRLDQWADGFSPNQWWRAVPADGGGHRLVNVASGHCLDVLDGSTADGARLVQRAIDAGSESQRWRIEPA
ncbi:glycosyl hydrolase family 95 catalytic domain-containing protein [Agromyces salentinus]|uniref:Glycoside hydrolase N-terminal domain-containing protein n=1 Tax=Agromyces salentinus TaxID=269421 RepID=A0ABP4YV62_9MICO|nr:RICIN domain-containing protein [Agromyces salentinus]